MSVDIDSKLEECLGNGDIVKEENTAGQNDPGDAPIKLKMKQKPQDKQTLAIKDKGNFMAAYLGQWLYYCNFIQDKQLQYLKPFSK